MKIEVTTKLNLKDDENWKINLHSFYNILNVLNDETSNLIEFFEDNHHIDNILKKINSVKIALSEPQKTRETLQHLSMFRHYIINEVNEAINNDSQFGLKKLSELEKSLTNFERVLAVAQDRTDEFLTFIDYKDKFITYDTRAIIIKINDFFATMAARSNNRYGVTFKAKGKQESDYYFDLDFQPNTKLTVPVLFPDVIRDLLANSKKYSPVGSTIRCQLEQNDKVVMLTIKDSGRGIPLSDIDKVVNYGYRGTNVAESETFGDGFGLTKAYMITKEHEGRMWIDSVEGEYTIITIEIPVYST